MYVCKYVEPRKLVSVIVTLRDSITIVDFSCRAFPSQKIRIAIF